MNIVDSDTATGSKTSVRELPDAIKSEWRLQGSDPETTQCLTCGLSEKEKAISTRLRTLCALAAKEVLEYGVESQFSEELAKLIREYHDDVIEDLAQLILSQGIDEKIGFEILRWLGLIEDKPTHRYRLELLKDCLHSPSVWIRDGALQGIESLDDPYAIPRLRQVIQWWEKVPWLRDDMKEVLRQLESTHSCHLS